MIYHVLKSSAVIGIELVSGESCAFAWRKASKHQVMTFCYIELMKVIHCNFIENVECEPQSGVSFIKIRFLLCTLLFPLF